MEEDEAGERWLLNIEAFGKQQVSVKFTNEHEAHQMAEEWTRAMDRVARLADTMQRNGFGYTVR